MAPRLGISLATSLVAAAVLVLVGAATASAASNPWPHEAVDGFSTPNGVGFWLTYADGTVAPVDNAPSSGDASGIDLSGPIVGGAAVPNGAGYWLVASDGGIFTYGSATFHGSTGSMRLNQPVFSMAPTNSGNGYWLVARDGGIFAFGDAPFYGSTGAIQLNEPINGIGTSPSAHGYRMVAKDGGIFSFGDIGFYGSLPGIGIHVSDVVGTAATPSNKGYWIAEADGSVHAFGDAQNFGSYAPSLCDVPTAIFSNPNAQGYRLLLQSGATIAFGEAPGGTAPTGTPRPCPTVSLPDTFVGQWQAHASTVDIGADGSIAISWLVNDLSHPELSGVVEVDLRSTSVVGNTLYARVVRRNIPPGLDLTNGPGIGPGTLQVGQGFALTLAPPGILGNPGNLQYCDTAHYGPCGA